MKIFNSNEEHTISIGQGENPYFADYEIKALQFSLGAITVKFYMVAMAGFLALIVATWVRAVVKIVRN